MSKFTLPPIPPAYTLPELESKIKESFAYLDSLKKNVFNVNNTKNISVKAFETEAKKVLDLYHKAIIRFKSNMINQLDITKQFDSQYSDVIKDLNKLGHNIKPLKSQSNNIRNALKRDIKASFNSYYDIKESQLKQSIELWDTALKNIDSGIFNTFTPKTTILDVGKWSKYKPDGGKWKALQKRAFVKQKNALSAAITEHVKTGIQNQQSVKQIMKGVVTELDQVFPDGTIPINRNITTKTGGKKLVTSYLDVGTYAQGWVRTFDTLSYNESYLANCIKLGITKISVKGTATSCPICKLYIGKTYSIEKGTKSGIGKIPPYHTHCDCLIVTEGVTDTKKTIIQPTPKKKTTQKPAKSKPKPTPSTKPETAKEIKILGVDQEKILNNGLSTINAKLEYIEQFADPMLRKELTQVGIEWAEASQKLEQNITSIEKARSIKVDLLKKMDRLYNITKNQENTQQYVQDKVLRKQSITSIKSDLIEEKRRVIDADYLNNYVDDELKSAIMYTFRTDKLLNWELRGATKEQILKKYGADFVESGQFDIDYIDRFKYMEDLDEFLANAPKINRVVYRGEAIDADRMKDILNAKETGNPIKRVDYLSTTNSLDVAQNFSANSGYMFEIRTKSGVDMSSFSLFEGESEVLIPRNTEFKVVDIVEDMFETKVILEEV